MYPILKKGQSRYGLDQWFPTFQVCGTLQERNKFCSTQWRPHSNSIWWHFENVFSMIYWKIY